MKVKEYEIDMLGVGAADALLIRFFDEEDEAHVVLVDAGNYSDGKTVCDFVKNRYNTYKIDLAICTHCDDDHFGGFVYMIKDMIDNPKTSVDIKNIIINDPGHHITTADVKWYENEENVKAESRSVYDCGDYNLLNLVWKAEKVRGLNYREGFSDVAPYYFDGIINIIAPSKAYYKEQALQFRNKLQPYDYVIEGDDEDALEIPETKRIFSKRLDEAGSDPSHHNKSSIMFIFDPGNGKKYLFTGDADEDSFNKLVHKSNIDAIKDIYWLKVPHHGSAHNMSNDMINHLKPKVAYISTEKYGHYLDKSVMGALHKAGTRIYTTRNEVNVWHHSSTPDRDDYSTAKPE